MKNALAAVLVASGLTFVGASAMAAPNVPVSFAPTLGTKPAETQQKLTTLEGKLPATFALPASLQVLTSDTLTLSFFPEIGAQFGRAKAAKTTLMTWPTTTKWCVRHAAFTAPTSLLAAGAASSCNATVASAQAALADAGVCRDVEQPENYVLSYKPADVNLTTTGSIEALIGLAGEALSHHPTQDGLLPADFVDTLRSVLWKIRRAPIDSEIGKAHASYAQIESLLGTQASCFDPAARTALTAEIPALDNELSAVTTTLDSLAADGTQAAQHEVACMAGKSRMRADLPFPSLTRPEREAIAFWLGGIYWRMRGGGLMPTGSTQEARIYFLQRPFSQIATLTGGAGVGNDVGNEIYLNIFDGWGDWMDMGTTPGGQDLYEDLVDMTDRGRHQVQDNPLLPPSPSAVAYLDGKGYDTTALLTGGLDMGPCYAYALGQLKDFRYADTAPAPYGPFIEYFTAIGEFCTGASISLGMAKTLLDGVPNGLPPTDLCAGRTCGDDGCGGSCGAPCVDPTASDAGAVDADAGGSSGSSGAVADAPMSAGSAGCGCSTSARGGFGGGVLFALAALLVWARRRTL